jgi:hypothetical protein
MARAPLLCACEEKDEVNVMGAWKLIVVLLVTAVGVLNTNNADVVAQLNGVTC